MGDQNRPGDRNPQGWFVNLLGWLSFVGLFATGVVGLTGGAASRGEPHLAGVAYLLVGGLAFGLVLVVVLRRGPMA
ncbi:hypothetical protein [Frigoriglobus tundricola]|uniref:Uncharacterized protein n=1 Tax=Frigoriglobus tundricola TaxID=2774151 RepID=A0A6M5YIB1_9BACT|nr:hypothetical protein [Frigoriglobus tundricola]QJW93787.1 hypothetical protein FTUN_1298 [Frigoriglobus tundricola]